MRTVCIFNKEKYKRRCKGRDIMRIEWLKLENFQGIENFESGFSPNGNIVIGKNGAGKSTILNAICWLIIGKPYDLSKGYSPKTTDHQGKERHNLIHRAEADFRMADGAKIRLSKTYRESWRKKRGSSQTELVGHLTEYAIDGVPCKEKDYLLRLNEICPAQEASILMLPGYFAENLKWQDRRTMLLKLAKDIKDEEILEKMPEGEELNSLLGSNIRRYSVEEYMAIAKASMTETNKELNTIGARIDEAKRAVPKMEMDEQSVIEALQVQRKVLESLEEKKARLLTGDKDSQYLRRKSELTTAIAAQKAKISQHVAEKNTAQLSEMRILEEQFTSLHVEYQKVYMKYQENKAMQKKMAEGFHLLMSQIKEEKEKSWAGDTICPTCGQALSEERIMAARVAFLEARDKKIAEYEKLGKEKYGAERFRFLAEEVRNSKQAMCDLQNEMSQQEDKISALRMSIGQPSKETEELKRLKVELEQLRDKHRCSIMQDLDALQIKINAARATIRNLEGDLTEIEWAKNQKSRVRELQNRQKELGQQYENWEHGLWLCEQFISRKADALNESINIHFPSVRFTLYRPQINGGIESVCEVMANTESGQKPYIQANHVAKIKADMEIARVFSKHWGMDLPFLVDESQSITDFDFAGELQTVRVIAQRQRSLTILSEQAWEQEKSSKAA